MSWRVLVPPTGEGSVLRGSGEILRAIFQRESGLFCLCCLWKQHPELLQPRERADTQGHRAELSQREGAGTAPPPGWRWASSEHALGPVFCYSNMKHPIRPSALSLTSQVGELGSSTPGK